MEEILREERKDRGERKEEWREKKKLKGGGYKEIEESTKKEVFF